MRVVTLLPSATEIVCALGVDPVAVSHECDWPPSVRGRPTVVESRVDDAGTSADVDAQVLEAESEGGVYEIDREALEAAAPDLVVTQGICDVCAVDRVLVREAVDDLGLDCEVLTTDPHSLGDVFEDVERVGAALDREERAADLVADLRERVERVRERRPTERPRVAVLDWMDPVMTAGHWVPELIELAGGEPCFDDDRSVPREWDAVREAAPGVLVVAPCGFDLARTTTNLPDLTDREGWDALPAVEAGRAYAVDGNHYLNRPGPRLVDSLEYLAGLLHPEVYERPPSDVARAIAGADREASLGAGADD